VLNIINKSENEEMFKEEDGQIDARF